MILISRAVHKAAACIGPVPDMHIEATDTIPEAMDMPIKDYLGLMDTDAARLYEALTAALPQGTLDRLFALLAKRACSSLIIPDKREDHARTHPG